MTETLSISIRDVSPGSGAERITGIKPNGEPDGMHTGGAWRYRGEVWKPLDGRPYGNADFHVSTLEDACLEEMVGAPLFPKNWRVETANGRRFLVRKEAKVLSAVDRVHALAVIRGISELNRRGWAVSDDVSIGINDRGDPFVVDLSIASRLGGAASLEADRFFDFWLVARFLQESGHTDLANAFRCARTILDGLTLETRLPGLRYVYAGRENGLLPNTVDLTPDALRLLRDPRRVGDGLWRFPHWVGSAEEVAFTDMECVYVRPSPKP